MRLKGNTADINKYNKYNRQLPAKEVLRCHFEKTAAAT
jgi:hypothetical protein